MAKIRGIKPETWTDAKFVRLSPLARLLFLGMWNYSCDNGHVSADPFELKIRILPADTCDVESLLAELVKTGQVEQADGYFKVVKLAEHQRIDLRYLSLCEHCEHDADTVYAPSDKTGSPSRARRAPTVRTSGAHVDGDGDGDGDGDRQNGTARGATPKPKRATKLPADWTPSPEHEQRARDSGIDINREVVKFRAHAEDKGRTSKSWNAAFTQWLIKAAEYAPAYGRPSPGAKPRIDQWRAR